MAAVKNRIKKLKTRVGKAQARQEFSPLIEAVAAGAGPIEITDYGKVVAVLVSEKEYQWLCARAEKTTTPKRDLRGLIIFHDDLEALSKTVAADIDKSIERTAKNL